MSKKQHIFLSQKIIKELVNDCFINHVFSSCHDKMDDNMFQIFLKNININSLDDESFLKDERIRRMVDWENMSRKKIIRLMTRDLSILNYIDFEKQKFSITELEIFLRFHPEYINDLNIDFDKIIPKEVLILLKIDPGFCEYVDLYNVQFNRLELQELVKNFIFNENVITKINFNLFDNYINRYVLKKTSTKYIDKINLDSLNVLDWVDILQKNPGMFKYCNTDLFLKGDCFNLIKIASCVYEAYELIEKNKDLISGLGWEKLLLIDLEKYQKICNWSKLNNLNFKILKKKYPDIEKYVN